MDTNTQIFHLSKKWIFIGASFIFLFLLVIVMVYLLLSHNHTNDNSVSLVSKKTYTDKMNVYSIAVPKNWTITENQGQNIIDQNTPHPITQQIEIAQLYLPNQYGISVQVMQGVPHCPLPALNTSLAGLPAYYDMLGNDWTIPTTTATIQVGISYPGPGRYNNPFSKSPTPVPSETITADKQLLLNLLQTISLRNLTPFHC